MAVCSYKKIFLKDLAAIPNRYRSRIERLVFEQIPASEDIFHDFDIRKMRGYPSYYCNEQDNTGSDAKFPLMAGSSSIG